ncbi:MAG: hypothetical protein CMD92_00165 [Gammaproteobacteria bacterium]|nr:hypothetical protein [Gammaproteobacteria bacterium]HBW84335.1 hypothetical protein [Gammaproteobacteria bacterium]
MPKQTPLKVNKAAESVLRNPLVSSSKCNFRSPAAETERGSSRQYLRRVLFTARNSHSVSRGLRAFGDALNLTESGIFKTALIAHSKEPSRHKNKMRAKINTPPMNYVDTGAASNCTKQLTYSDPQQSMSV